MKRSPYSCPLINETGYFCGVSLAPQIGYAEHEPPIISLHAAFGIKSPSSAPVAQKHNIQCCPSDLFLVECEEDSLLAFTPYRADEFRQRSERRLNTLRLRRHGIPCDPNRMLSGAWNHGDFAIYGVGKGRQHLRELYASFKALDTSILYFDQGSQRCAGSLCIVISSRIPIGFWPEENETALLS